ncbi:MAG: threonine synthase, partial [Oscillospiraceae bacterium]|nr:threonine synthase [Oscillospiraceae bacterium]
PVLESDAIDKLRKMSYRQRAVYIMKLFLEDFTEGELEDFTAQAYCAPGFDTPDIAPVRQTSDGNWFLELWHGPTCAFKDMALQMLPYLLTASLDKTGEKRQVCILVATSGDTGKAALEGFRDVPRTKIIVFYPKDGVSDIQQLQMTTQLGENVNVCSVVGNFDDAQTGVKKIFSDEALRERLSEKGFFLSSANSINWGRLLPQVVYYISAYCDLINAGSVKNGDKVNFCVPTGNFGDILAGYYAKCMGLPVNRLICASNRNDVLTEFINTGVYNKNRQFYTTISPSMDILVSSNLERLLFELSGKDDKLVSGYMEKLNTQGKYEVTPEIKKLIDENFECGCSTEEETKATIRETFEKYGYLIDTHTAVAYSVLKKYQQSTKDDTVSVVVSTASPYKFCAAVLDALGKDAAGSGLDLIDRLSTETDTAAPTPLSSLRGRQVRFDRYVQKQEMTEVVEGFLS